MPMLAVLGRDHHVAAAEQGGVAGEAVAGGDADERHEPAEPGEQVEGAAVEARDDRPCPRPRAPAAALGEQHDRQPPALGDLEQAVLLLVVAHPLGAGEHGVVVGHRHAAARRRPRRRRATRPSAGVRAISSSRRAPALLRGEQQRPVLDEGALVDEFGEVLARGAPALLAPPGDGLRAGRRRVRSRGARAPPRRSAALAGSWDPRPSGLPAPGGPLAGASDEQQLRPRRPRRRRPPRAAARPRRSRRAISCSIFIASSTTTGAPARTGSSLRAGSRRRRRTGNLGQHGELGRGCHGRIMPHGRHGEELR